MYRLIFSLIVLLVGLLGSWFAVRNFPVFEDDLCVTTGKYKLRKDLHDV